MDRGHFAPHRDNNSPITAHRRFALSLNLNDAYEGGELYFPEYGSKYRPEIGDGVVFSCSLVHGAAPVTRGERFLLVAMLGGELDLAVYEAGRQIANGAMPLGSSHAQLADDARKLREVAGDVAVFGDSIARVPGAAQRLSRIHAELTQLQTDLSSARGQFLEDQVAVRRVRGRSEIKLHLGCGVSSLAGWVNVDTRDGDVRMDLRWPLPFTDRSVRYVFACHVIEHFYRKSELPRLLSEVHRVLAPGGVLRLVVPDIEKCLRAYVSADDQFFADRSQTWHWATSCKTRLDHFLAYAGADQSLEDFDGHKYGYDFETLSLLLREVGFNTIERSEFMASRHAELRVDLASHNATAKTGATYYSLFVEAIA
jgi:predicted SAM-dependent methyltransferase